jgi:hypothetical protein
MWIGISFPKNFGKTVKQFSNIILWLDLQETLKNKTLKEFRTEFILQKLMRL